MEIGAILLQLRHVSPIMADSLIKLNRTANYMFETAVRMLYCCFRIILRYQSNPKEICNFADLINKK